MKSMKKLISFVLVFVMLTALTVTASAASISISQDSSYQGTDGEAGRSYSYYKVFSAKLGDDFTGTTMETGHDANGVPTTEQGTGKVAYTATNTVAAKLGSWDATNKTWTKATGNEWFNLAPIAGTTNYSVTWDTTKDGTDPDVVQAAAAWLIANSAYESGPTAMTFDSSTKKWTSGDIDAGYYIVKPQNANGDSTGANLVAATTDITIAEKNDYPPIFKTQTDPEHTEPTEDSLPGSIGEKLSYQAKVTIPTTAKVGDTMAVADTPSQGLTYVANSVKVSENTGNATVAFNATPAEGDAWSATITVTDGSQGKDVIFTYDMIINESALVDTGRMNKFKLVYGDEYTAIPKTVPFTTYFGGIIKYKDSAAAGNEMKNKNVKFTLFENGVAFPVTLTNDGYYIPAVDTTTGLPLDGAKNEVVTDENGLIRIRGLDNDNVYTLTEIETEEGYNLLAEDVTLKLHEDKGDAFTNMTPQDYDPVINNAGTVLPSTGGIGTTLFYVFGTLLVLAAGVVLVTKRRVRE